MKKIIISAVALNNVIGMKSKIPWIDKKEINYFKETTQNSIVMMGRKTYDSIGKILPKRKNFVITTNKVIKSESEDLYFFNSICESISYGEKLGIPTMFIIGGSEIYEQTINIADEIFISRMPFTICGDKSFPEISESDWRLYESIDMDSFTIEKYIKN